MGCLPLRQILQPWVLAFGLWTRSNFVGKALQDKLKDSFQILQPQIHNLEMKKPTQDIPGGGVEEGGKVTVGPQT